MGLHNRLALGTVQFGRPYGVANQSGQVGREEAAAILDHAWKAGLNSVDTAIAYGESEQRLGEVGIGQWRIISKLPTIPEKHTDIAAWVQASVLGSLARLRVPKLHGLLLHRSQQLLGSQGATLYRALIALKDHGMVEKIGISIYSPDELDALWPYFQFDLVQAPFNIIDRRLTTSGWLKRLHEAGTEIHIRSVFLQGLLLMKSTDRPAIFSHWQPLWDQWHHWLDDQSVTALQACLGFAMAQPEIDCVVVGVDSLKQLQEILTCVEVPPVVPPATLISWDLDLINPSRWNES